MKTKEFTKELANCYLKVRHFGDGPTIFVSKDSDLIHDKGRELEHKKAIEEERYPGNEEIHSIKFVEGRPEIGLFGHQIEQLADEGYYITNHVPDADYVLLK